MVINGSRGSVESGWRDKIKLLSLSHRAIVFGSVQFNNFSNKKRKEGSETTTHCPSGVCDLEIKFKLLIVFNTLLCPAKHLNYLLEGLSLHSRVCVCEGERIWPLDIDIQ